VVNILLILRSGSVKLTTTLHLVPGLRTQSNPWRGALTQGGTVFLIKQADQI
jgi:hypothetical protein